MTRGLASFISCRAARGRRKIGKHHNVTFGKDGTVPSSNEREKCNVGDNEEGSASVDGRTEQHMTVV